VSNEHYRRTTSPCFSAIGEAIRGVIQNPENTMARKFERASGPFFFCMSEPLYSEGFTRCGRNTMFSDDRRLHT